MSDIAKRLRWCAIHGDQMQAIKAMEQGAAEIERLREALAEISVRGLPLHSILDIARAALEARS